jgi:hypothetical protein
MHDAANLLIFDSLKTRWDTITNVALIVFLAHLVTIREKRISLPVIPFVCPGYFAGVAQKLDHCLATARWHPYVSEQFPRLPAACKFCDAARLFLDNDRPAYANHYSCQSRRGLS